jgi:hypothetical protein
MLLPPPPPPLPPLLPPLLLPPLLLPPLLLPPPPDRGGPAVSVISDKPERRSEVKAGDGCENTLHRQDHGAMKIWS